MNAKLLNATESVDRLRQMFEALYVLSDAVKAGLLEDQTVAERKTQLARLESDLAEAKKNLAVVEADIVQHAKAAEANQAEVQRRLKIAIDDANARAGSLVKDAEAQANAIATNAAKGTQEALAAHAAVMAEKQAKLADLDRQVQAAADRLADLHKQSVDKQAQIEALKSAAAKVLG